MTLYPQSSLLVYSINCVGVLQKMSSTMAITLLSCIRAHVFPTPQNSNGKPGLSLLKVSYLVSNDQTPPSSGLCCSSRYRLYRSLQYLLLTSFSGVMPPMMSISWLLSQVTRQSQRVQNPPYFSAGMTYHLSIDYMSRSSHARSFSMDFRLIDLFYSSLTPQKTQMLSFIEHALASERL